MDSGMKMKLFEDREMPAMSCQARRMILISACVLGGVAAASGAGIALWNSKAMKRARCVKRTGQILYRVGTAMRNVSCIMTE